MFRHTDTGRFKDLPPSDAAAMAAWKFPCAVVKTAGDTVGAGKIATLAVNCVET